MKQMQTISKAQNNRQDTPESWVELLAKVSLLDGLKGNTLGLRALSECIEERRYVAGARVISEKEIGGEAFFLIEGSVSILKTTPDGESFSVAVLRAETLPFFGETSLLQTETRTATVVAESNCRCLVLSRGNFERYAEKYPQLALPIMKEIAALLVQRLRQTNDDFLRLYKALLHEISGAGGH